MINFVFADAQGPSAAQGMCIQSTDNCQQSLTTQAYGEFAVFMPTALVVLVISWIVGFIIRLVEFSVMAVFTYCRSSTPEDTTNINHEACKAKDQDCPI